MSISFCDRVSRAVESIKPRDTKEWAALGFFCGALLFSTGAAIAAGVGYCGYKWATAKKDVVRITPQAQLNRLPTIATKVGEISGLIPDLANIVDQYVGEKSCIYSNWHIALKKLGLLPRTIPPLPDDIVEQLNSPCPVFRDGRTVADTHTLLLIPGGLTLNEFEERAQAYGAANYQGDNPLQCRYFWDRARQKHGNTLFGDAHWVLVTKDIIPVSRNKSYADQSALVTALDGAYEVPSLNDMIPALFLHKIATGESLYQEVNEENGNTRTYTRVQETMEGYYLAVGKGRAPSGVHVCHNFAYAREDFGVAALRKF